ncbi:unnamed protein product [Coregonus sp. 'balchen']|nr:unnamed protein product [Coregonus sp. 'balchen']
MQLLWVVVVGVLGVFGAEGEQALCRILGSPEFPLLSKEGDVTIGGAFSIHTKITETPLSFTETPPPLTCSSMNLQDVHFAQTMIFAIEEINNSTSLLPNISIGYRIYDSCGSTLSSMHVAMALMNGQERTVGKTCSGQSAVHAIIGASDSSSTIVMSRSTGAFQIPVISHYATCACLSNRKEFPSFFRTIPSDFYQSRALAQLVKHFGWTWVGAVRSDNDYGNNGMATFVEAAGLEGVCIEYSEAILWNSPREQIARVVEVIGRASSRVVVAFVTQWEMDVLLEEALAQNLTGLQWVGSESWITVDRLATRRRSAVLSGALGFTISKSKIPGLREFLLRVGPAQDPNNTLLREFWEVTFSCRFSPQEESDGGPSQSQCSGSERLEEINNSFTDTSELRFSNNVYKAVYAVAHSIHDLLTCTHGKGQGGNRNCSDRDSIEPGQVSSYLYRYLRDVNFTMKSGERVYFDENGDPTATYELMNWQRDQAGETVFVTVGNYDASLPNGDQFSMNRIKIAWAGNSLKTPIVKASNTELSFLLLFSLTLCFLCSLTFIGRPSEWSCMLRHTVFGITFALCMSCVLAKTIAVVIAFQATMPGNIVPQCSIPLQRVSVFSCTFLQVVIHSCPAEAGMAPRTDVVQLLLVVGVSGMVAAAPACSLLGQPALPLLSAEGDINIGAVFSLHRNALFKVHSFTFRPEKTPCISFNPREFQFAQTLIFALEEINNSSDLLPGLSLGYQVYDSCGSVPLAIHSALALMNSLEPEDSLGDPSSCSRPPAVLGIVGESSSTPTIGISSLVGPFSIPVISHFATCACLSNRKRFPSFFRTIPSDFYQSRALAKLVKHFGWTWVGVVNSNSDYGNNGMASFMEAARHEGVCVEYQEAIYRTDPRERLLEAVRVIRRATARVVVLFLGLGDLIPLLNELALEGDPGLQWVGSESWITARLLAENKAYSFLSGAVGFAIRNGQAGWSGGLPRQVPWTRHQTSTRQGWYCSCLGTIPCCVQLA